MIHIETGRVGFDWYDARTGGQERMKGWWIGQVVESHRIARADEHAAGQEDRHLAAACDADIFSSDGQTAIRVQHIRERFAQTWMPAGITVVQAV